MRNFVAKTPVGRSTLYIVEVSLAYEWEILIDSYRRYSKENFDSIIKQQPCEVYQKIRRCF